MRQDVSKLSSLFTLCVIWMLGLAVPQADAACAELSFGPAANYAGGLQTHGLVSGDLNGDGNVDLAAANESSGTLVIRFGDGAGAFPTAITFFTSAPSSVAIADFNNDGIADLVTSNRSLNVVTVRLGLGGGAFRPPVQTSVGSSPSGLSTGDFNGDGNIDIVVSNGTAFSLLLGTPTGAFPVATSIPVPGAAGIAGIVSADFNADGHRDVATLNRTSLNISILFGDGNTGFNPAATLPAGGSEPGAMTVGDLNGDTRPDLVTANAGSNNVTARFNNGSGFFGSALALPSGIEPFSVAIGDLDNDGHGDIVASNRRSRTLSVFRGNGEESFAARIDYPVSLGPRAVVVDDMDGNGMMDLAAGIDSGHIAVLLNTCSPNSAPTISAGAVTRQQDSSANSTIATVGDSEDDAEDLNIQINGGTSATMNGVTVSNIVIGPAGDVSADVSASCGASDATFDLVVTDGGGLSATATLNVEVVNETTAPVINDGKPLPNMTVYLPANSTDTSMPVMFDLPVAADNCSAEPSVSASPESGSIFNIGTTTVTVIATDELDNTASAMFTITVLFNFGGFHSPIETFPALNIANAGSSIPIKFSLSGDKGMNILAPGYPASSAVPCDEAEPGSTIEETITPGSGLTYDAATDQYSYVWKTEKSWRRTCRILILKLADGSEHYARFSFR